MKHLYPWLTLMVVCGCASALWGQEADSFRLESVEIQAARVPTRFDERARSVEVLTSADLKRLPIQSVQDALEYLTGVDVRQRGPLGIQANVSIRGGTFNQVQVLIDGVMASDPQTGHFILNVPLMPDDIERIEVLKGPGAKVFGQNAFAGAINIVTKAATERALRVSASGGQHGLYEGGASFTTIGSRMSHRLSALQRGSSGYSDNTDFSLTNALYQAKLNTSGAEYNLTAGYLYRRFGAMRFYQASPPRQYETNEGFFVSMAGAGKGRWSFRPQLYWRRHWDDYRLIREREDTARNKHRSDVVGLQWNLHRLWAGGVTAVGGDLRLEAVTSTNLGDHSRWNGGLFVEHRLSLWKRLDLTPGFYVNAFTGQQLRVYPGLDVGLALNERGRLFANVGRAFRMPTYTEQFLNQGIVGAAVRGNAGLMPEDAWAYELGTRWQWPGWRAELIGFVREGDRLIDLSQRLDLPLSPLSQNPRTFRNVQQVQTSGYELSASWLPGERRSTLPLTRLRLGFTYLTQRGQPEGFTSFYAFNFLRGQLTLESAWRIASRLELSLTARAEDRASLPTPYWLLDARLSWTAPRWQAYLEGTNLTDTPYADIVYSDGSRIAMPLRWLRAGVSVRIF